MLQDPADIPERKVRKAGVAVAGEQWLAAFPQTDPRACRSRYRRKAAWASQGHGLAMLPGDFFKMYLYHIRLSAILVRLLKACRSRPGRRWRPRVLASTAIPICSMTKTITERRSCMLSVGGTGK